MTTQKINCFYLGTDTVDYSIELTKTEEGVNVNCSEYQLENEFFPVGSAEEFVEDYKADYMNENWEEGKNYEIETLN